MNKGVAVVSGSHPALFENRVIDGEIFVLHLPQDQRSGIDPYLDIPWSTGHGLVAAIPKSSDVSRMLLLRIGIISGAEFKDLCDFAESLFFTVSRGLAKGIFRLRANALVV